MSAPCLGKQIESRMKEMGMPHNMTCSSYWSIDRASAFMRHGYVLVVVDNEDAGYIKAVLTNPATGEMFEEPKKII